MRKKVLSLMLISAMVLSACGKKDKVDDYPGDTRATAGTAVEETAGDKNTSGDKETGEDSRSLSQDGKVKWSFAGNEAEIETDAVVVGDAADSYPVSEITYTNITDEYVASLSDAIFDEGSVSVMMPSDLADLDYVNHRIEMLDERKKSYGDKVPGYVEVEYNHLVDLREKNQFENTIECPKEPKVLDISEWLRERGVDLGEVSFCILEGTIDGEFYRMNAYTMFNYRTVCIYRENANDQYPDMYSILSDEDKLCKETEGTPISQEEAESQMNLYMKRLNIQGFQAVETHPVNFAGSIDNPKYQYAKPGFAVFASSSILGRTEPVTRINDLCMGNYYDLYADMDNLKEFADSEIPIDGGMISIPVGSSVVGVFDNKGLSELTIANPYKAKEDGTKDAAMLSFDEIDKRAQDFCEKAVNSNDSQYQILSTDKNHVTKIQLGMCKSEVDLDKVYMVPAWYYLSEPDYGAVDTPIFAVNALDGSIIDVSTGGYVIKE